MKTLLTTLILAAGLIIPATAQVVVRIGPPRTQAERRPPSPGRGYVWVPGYQNWNGSRYEWAAGRWERPPQGRKHWDKHRWVKRNGGWVLVEGRWR